MEVIASFFEGFNGLCPNDCYRIERGEEERWGVILEFGMGKGGRF